MDWLSIDSPPWLRAIASQARLGRHSAGLGANRLPHTACQSTRLTKGRVSIDWQSIGEARGLHTIRPGSRPGGVPQAFSSARHAMTWSATR